MHKVDFVTIPTARSKQFHENKPILCTSKDEWINQIRNEVRKLTENVKRSVLIICETVNDVQVLQKAFGENDAHVHTYIRDFEEFDIGQDDKKLEQGQIIIATNLAGRGTDIKITDTLRTAGGLHVCLTYLPNNIRIEQQAFGRAARSGDKGSGQLIIMDLKEQEYSNSRIFDLKKERDAEELHRISDTKAYYETQITLEESCFKKFKEQYELLKKDLDDKKVPTEVKEILLQSCLDKWAFWLDKHNKSMRNLTKEQDKKNLHHLLDKFISQLKNLDTGYSEEGGLLFPSIEYDSISWLAWIEENPVQMVKLGRYLSQNQQHKNAYESAIQLFNDVITKDSYISEAAHYYKACALATKINWEQIGEHKQNLKQFKNELREAARLLDEQSIFATSAAGIIKKIKKNNTESVIKIDAYEEQQKSMANFYYMFSRSIDDIFGHAITPQSLLNDHVNEELAESIYKALFEKGILKKPKVNKNVSEKDLKTISSDYGVSSEIFNFLSKYKGKEIHEKEFQKVLKKEVQLPNREVFWKSLIKQEVLIEEVKYVVVDKEKLKKIPSLLNFLTEKVDNKELKKQIIVSNNEQIFLHEERIGQQKSDYVFKKDDFKNVVDKAKYQILKNWGILSFNKQSCINPNKIKSATFSCYDSITLEDFSKVSITTSEAAKILAELIERNVLEVRDNSENKVYELKIKFDEIKQVRLSCSVYENAVKGLLSVCFAYRIALQKIAEQLEEKNFPVRIQLMTKPYQNLVSELLEQRVIKPVRVTNETECLENTIEEILRYKPELVKEETIKDITKNIVRTLERSRSSLKTLKVPDYKLTPFTELCDQVEFANIEEVHVFFLNGLDQLLQLQEKKWTRKMLLNAAGVTVLGISQIAVGTAIELYSVGFMTDVGEAFINEGISDLFFAVGALKSGYFSWEDYGRYKLESLMITAATVGMGAYHSSGAKISRFGSKLAAPTFEVDGKKVAQMAGTELLKTTGYKVVGKEIAKRIVLKATEAFALVDVITENQTYVGKKVQEAYKSCNENWCLEYFEEMKQQYEEKLREHDNRSTTENNITEKYHKSLLKLMKTKKSPKLFAAIVREGIPMDLTCVVACTATLHEIVQEQGVSGLTIIVEGDNGIGQTFSSVPEGTEGITIRLKLKDNHFQLCGSNIPENNGSGNNCLYDALGEAIPQLKDTMTPEQFRTKVADRIEHDEKIRHHIQQDWHRHPIFLGAASRQPSRRVRDDSSSSCNADCQQKESSSRNGDCQQKESSSCNEDCQQIESSSSSCNEDCQQIEDCQYIESKVLKHFKARLLRFFRLGGRVQKISELTGVDRAEIVTGGASQYQDRRSGQGHGVHAAHVIRDIRLQLNEQLRCLDVRMEAQVALLTELQDFFRRRGELELDYSKNLDKLAKSLQLRHKEQKQKREQWPLFSSYACWQQLVTQTKNLSRDHVALSEVYSTHLVSRLSQVMEDVQRIYKRCREIGYETHEEILRVLHELHTTMKTYHSYQAELRQAEAKLRSAEIQRTKLEQSLSQDKLDRSKKYKLMEKEVMKRKNKYSDAKLKALKARNEYILCLEASNTTIHKYFVDDLSDLIDCMDFGFHNCISRALLMHVTAEEGCQKSVQNGLDTLSACINSLDSRLDKQRFLECNHSAFMIPKKLEFQGQKTDEQPEPEIQNLLHREMETRLTQLQQRVTSLRAESEEVWKTLETAESTLLEMLSAKDYDCSGYFGDNAVPASKPPETVSIKLRADRQETEEFYLAKFREYLLGSSRIARLDAKQECLRQSLVAEAPDFCSSIKPVTKTPKRKRIGRLQMGGQPKLFGGSIEEYQEATNQEIPLIMKSCIRVINLYGLHHQGIFRVSGSQVEINNFREWFERGEDPLADMTDASDINSVAGVLKLYLRELREPLFPIIYFEQFMELAQLDSKREFISRMRELINSLPRSIMVVLRYLFAFLNHLSEFSDENMMDPYNLAICFGPTLVPVPEDKDQVQYQNQVNELIKNIIIFSDEIYPSDGGTVYEKYISPNCEDQDVGDSPSDQTQEDMDSEVYPSEDDSENIEATAQFDFIARSDRELSLKRGDSVTLYSQVSNDWWRGAVNGHEGLIPDKYISLKMKDDDRDKLGILKSSSSEESVRRRASSSNDSMLSESSVSVSNSPLVQCTSVTWTKVSDIAEASVNENTSVLLNQTREAEPSNTKDNNTSPYNTVDTDKFKQKLVPELSSVLLTKAYSEDGKSNPVNENCKHKSEGSDVSEVERCEIDESNVNFSQNRELWQKRALEATPSSPLLKSHRLSEPYLQRQIHTPDLVMDLPQVGNSSPKEQLTKSMSILCNLYPDSSPDEETNSSTVSDNSSDVESPDMQTAAETFAKQNQCTLKKNKKNQISDNSEYVAITSPMLDRKYATLGSNSTTTTFKPESKTKPMVLKKPVFSVPLRSVSIEMMCKDPPDLST